MDLANGGGLKFDPATMGAGHYVHTLPVLRTLLLRDKDGSFDADLAQGARIVDPSTIEVTLRPNSKFGDGTTLNAAAVKATFERNLASNNANGLQIPDMQLVKTLVADGNKLTIKTHRPSAGAVYALLAGVEFAPMSPKSFTDGTNLNTAAIGAGPMRLTNYVTNQRVEFEKNPFYWDAENVLLKGMQYVHTTVGSAVINGLRSGAIDAAQIEPDQAQNMQGDLKADFVRSTSALTMSMCIKDGTPLGNVKVRQAIAYALDRDSFNGIIFNGRSSESWDLFPSSSPLHNKNLDDLYKRNIPRAKQLLSEAGYPNGVKFSLVTPQNFATAGEVVQNHLKDAGIEVTLAVSNNLAADFYANVRYDANLGSSRPGPWDKVSRFYLSDSFGNVCKYPVPQVDSLYAKVAGLATDDPAAIPLWHKLSEVIFKDLAFFPQVVWVVGGFGYNTDRIGNFAAVYDQLGGRRVNPVGTYIRK